MSAAGEGSGFGMDGKMNPGVDAYFRVGCGRCPLGGTPGCKALSWTEPMVQLRRILLECGLVEEVKWSAPCYTSDGANIAMMGALKACCMVSFFKGALLEDPKGLLTKPGDQSQVARQLRFTDADQVMAMEPELKAFILEAIAVERSGRKVQLKSIDEHPVPEEWARRLEASPELKAAFERLTPGRRRGYLLHFGQPKQSATRESRIDRCLPKILEGKGLME
jgi:uncharacterized protein YdeI (YjbR/CyaY-like superfamily)